MSRNASTVNIPTIVASAGVAAVVSALIVTIGVVGLMISNGSAGRSAAVAETPTVVNLGAAQGATGRATVSGGDVGVPSSGAAAPTAEQVPDGGGGAEGSQPAAALTQSDNGGAGSDHSSLVGTQEGGGSVQAAPQSRQQAVTPAPLSPAQLNTKISVIMNTSASRSVRADELESGARGLTSIDRVAQLLRVSGAGFTYQMVGPVQQRGTTLSARLQMSLVGNGSRYRDLSWVWTGDKWKLSRKSVCDVAAYAMIPCSA
ncbi:hypothetical protein [Williamsia sterculiae]|uniref:hypothetical protein n=1 Tax=Williamsia sterculiae TaxID=1344003 RepID=UPI0009713568|nr:hypothetical protein [Williamsia sterculiae]